MNVLSVLGSPKKGGNTSALLQSLEKGMNERQDIQVESVVLGDLDIRYCTGCNSCKGPTKGSCIISDDMQGLYKKVIDADLLILATPVYWWNMSAQLKTFIDRFQALVQGRENSKLDGKRLILVMTHGSELPSLGAGIIEKSLSYAAEYTGMELLKVISVCSKVPVHKNETALNDAYNIGKNI